MEQNEKITDKSKEIFAGKIQNAGMQLIKLSTEILKSEELLPVEFDSVTVNLNSEEISFGMIVK